MSAKVVLTASRQVLMFSPTCWICARISLLPTETPCSWASRVAQFRLGSGSQKAKIRETFFVPLNARLDDPGRDFTRYPALAARNPTIVRSAMSSRIGVAFFEVERG
jgi:hypothetical protein